MNEEKECSGPIYRVIAIKETWIKICIWQFREADMKAFFFVGIEMLRVGKQRFTSQIGSQIHPAMFLYFN